ncbi:MAG: CXXX repeat peptide maturase [Prevotella sp.]|nr:CXXX repeat peptide maturase [Prevotella sp.]
MLQYIVILLNECSTSFCHYKVPKNNSWIDLEILKAGIRFAMMQNLMIQFVYPEGNLPRGLADIINTIDHTDIKPFKEGGKIDGEVTVFNELPTNLLEKEYPTLILRLTPQEFFDMPNYLVKQACKATTRVNVVIRDIDPILAWDFNRYKGKLEEISTIVEHEYASGNTTQWNILTDRMMLSKMNNCGAGDTSVALAPNGKFYICPAFYYDETENSVGDIYSGLDIPNQYLYKLEYAPICRHCDAYQCKRCVWLNRRMTGEMNTPSHEQCVTAHLEREVSRKLLYKIRKHGEFLNGTEILKIDYLDPFENRNKWL